VTHWDNDHSGGLKDLARNYKIEKIMCGIEQNNCTVKLEENDVIKYNQIYFEVVNIGGIVGKGVDESNGNSVVGLLRIFGKKFLMMADAPGQIEQMMVWQKKIREEVDVIKISHHGSVSATSDELLDLVKPKEAIVSVGKNNFCHPNKEVLEKLKKRNIKIRRTDKSGDIIYVL
jgi:competence protein ComEC